MKNFKRIGIVVPDLKEVKHYFDFFKFTKKEKFDREFYKAKLDNLDIIFTISNGGPVNASSATEALIILFNPEVIINSGSVGSHDHHILPGDIVIGEKFTTNFDPAYAAKQKEHARITSLIRYYKAGEKFKKEFIEADIFLVKQAKKVAKTVLVNQELFISNDKWPNNLKKRSSKVFQASIGSEDFWTTDLTDIKNKKEKFGYVIEDKETAYIAQICEMHDIPFLSIRCVSDNELSIDLGSRTEVKENMRKAGVRAAQVVIKFLTNNRFNN